MNDLYRILTKLVLEKLVIGLEEPILIKDVGELIAKVDSGNGGYNVIHGTDFVRQGNVLIFKTCDKDGNEKRVSKPIHSTINVNIGGGNIQERPVILLDIAFAGENYQSIPFSVTDRSSNSEKVLLCKDFVQDQLSALIDVTGKNLTDGQRVEYEETSSSLNEGFWNAVTKLSNTMYDYSTGSSIKDAIENNYGKKVKVETEDKKLAEKIKYLRNFVKTDRKNIESQLKNKSSKLVDWMKSQETNNKNKSWIGKGIDFLRNHNWNLTQYVNISPVKVVDYLGGTQQASPKENQQYFNGTYGVMSGLLGLDNDNSQQNNTSSSSTSQPLTASHKLPKLNSIFSKYITEDTNPQNGTNTNTQAQTNTNQTQQLDLSALNDQAKQLAAQNKLVENSNYFVLYYVPFQKSTEVKKIVKTYKNDFALNKIACTVLFSMIKESKSSEEMCVTVAQKIKEYIDGDNKFSLETSYKEENGESKTVTKPPLGFFFYCFGDASDRKANLLPIYTSTTDNDENSINEEMAKNIVPEEDSEPETAEEKNKMEIANEFLSELFQTDENVDFYVASLDDIGDFLKTIENLEKDMDSRFENEATNFTINKAQKENKRFDYDLALKTPSTNYIKQTLDMLNKQLQSGYIEDESQKEDIKNKISTLENNLKQIEELKKQK